MTDAAASATTWSTDGIPHHECLAAWTDRISAELMPLSTQQIDDRPFEGSIAVTRLGGLTLAEMTGSAHRIGPPSGLTGAPDRDGVLYLNAQLAGYSLARAHTHALTVHPGHLALMAGSWPTAVEFPEDFHQLIVKIPADMLLPRLACPQEALGRILSGTGTAGVVLNTLGYLTQPGVRLDHQARRLVAAHLVDYLALTFGPTPTASRSSRRHVLLQSALDEAARRLDDPALHIDQIARHLHISVRHLQRLFAEQGTTFGRWTTQQRIQRCRADFDADPTRQTPTAVIAARWGFPDRSHFSRVFFAHLGISPRDYRRHQPPGGSSVRGNPSDA